ncbi:MAG: DegT/DnrJ/EryC1/StrS family aminotransferase [Candidatus Hinthialibacter antarcticus]|nr:DegT/DnrJ/EryC1/StrS family aminotransferase [Candidatus Hinthialibacter antarcticus]
MNLTPAILGGRCAASPALPFARPLLPSYDDVAGQYRSIFSSGMVTTGPYAEQFAEAVADRLGVKYAVCVSSCTSGLMLAYQALSLPKEATVLVPSFTFMASGLASLWNHHHLKFIDIDPKTLNLDPKNLEESITDDCELVIGVHQFGAPAPIEEIQTIAEKHSLQVLYDSAHGLGSLHHGKPLGGNGRAEIFSLSPTKLVVAGEGGVVATNDEEIAYHLRIGRNYGNPGDYDCLFPGMNARMSEFHAILGLHSLKMLEGAVHTRNKIVGYYRERLGALPGVAFQQIAEYDRSSYKDFTLILEPGEFGLNAQQLAKALDAEGIGSRMYYAPVLHQMKVYQQFVDFDPAERLPNTVYLATRAISPPLYSDMREQEAAVVCEAIERIQTNAKAVLARLTA